jgi:hypothetical protein
MKPVSVKADRFFFLPKFLKLFKKTFIMEFTVSEYVKSVGQPFVYNIMGRTTAKGKVTFMVQLAQAISRQSTLAVGSRRTMILEATQDDINPRLLTFIMNLSAGKIDKFMSLAKLPQIPQQVLDRIATGETVSIFSAKESDKLILINDLDFFPIDVAIELTESPFQNPYNIRQDVFRNGLTLEPMEYTDVVTGEVVNYYAHTDLANAEHYAHQFIADYFNNDDSRSFPITVIEQIASDRKATVSTGANEIEVNS